MGSIGEWRSSLLVFLFGQVSKWINTDQKRMVQHYMQSLPTSKRIHLGTSRVTSRYPILIVATCRRMSVCFDAVVQSFLEQMGMSKNGVPPVVSWL